MVRLVVGLFFIVVPMLELAVLIKLGQAVGVWPTIALVITTAFTGILIISQQSFTVLRQTLEAMSEGRPPVTQVLDGLFLMVAGALLLTPGLITDVLALLLLVPPVRRAVGRWSINRLLAGTDLDDGDPVKNGHRAQSQPAAGDTAGPVIEGEFERLAETSTTAHRRGNGARPR